ncbi:MAG TPA: PSD1 and planctomycete cytochrome C domain-containing protein, partial [Candidatus Saccharimonadia bacterium]|nr:PSD1 and planctomycete cytochrome C domain-containing protein [Candidatus Saccharimonadia bacterium]
MFLRLTALACVLPAFGVLAAPSTEEVDFFEKRIRPVLVEQCYECHSEGKKVKGGLIMDHREAMLIGGDSGPSLVPGDPDKSKIIEAIRYKNRDMQMPPKNQLTAEQIRDLEKWVAMGAPDPREPKKSVTMAPAKLGMSTEEGRKFWSFAPLSEPAKPAVKNTAWVQTPVDAFILQSLEKSGLSPAPPADKRTLIRRATFDLTGLPPTPKEVVDFLADESPDAFNRVIERLLASPQYGERWARHWLDVARYADSNGLDENVALGHAWRYRDYVVRAFNEDKPYDQFLIEQLAGDLLPTHDVTSREDALTATAFLSLGAKVLAEPDVRKLEMDIIDDQLDTLGKAFMGMTIGCARCHDHKFDPFSQEDYYAMAAIFRSTKSLADEKMGAIKFWYEHSLATPADLEAKKKHEDDVKAQRAKITKYNSDTRTALKADLQRQAADYLAASVELPDDPDFKEVEAVAAKHGLRARYLLTCRQYLARATESEFFEKWNAFAKAGDTDGARKHYGKLFSDATKALAAAKKKDPKAVKPTEPECVAAHDALNDAAGFLVMPDKDAHAFDQTMLADVEQMQSALMEMEDKTPDPPSLMGVADGAVTRTLPIHIRGSYLTLGKEIERGFPKVMRVSFTKPVFPAKQSGRLELARWMASTEHPLTARVMANRIWRWHFGRGIVGTPDNFGILGDKPSHPALLDWLARNFMENGWSVKDMHRVLMKSSVYQMASMHPSAGQPSSSPDPALVDPENKLLWRANLQRLEAEQIRDALLASSGSLSLEMGGKTVPLRNREFVFNHTSKDATTYESPRRALYLPIIRNNLYDLLEQFDFPDPTMPTGSRNATVVAPQALIMLNSPLAMKSAEKLATKLLEQNSSDTVRVQSAYEALYARTATPQEEQRALTF